MKETDYVAGVEEGPTVLYNPDGTVQERSSFRAGVLHGETLTYHPNGAVKRRTIYRDGTPQGDPEEFDERGRALGEEEERRGILARLTGRAD